MPNRMLRDWTKSEKVDGLSFQAEVFFIRLIMKVDDYGRFYAHTAILKAEMFPLKLDKIREADILRWMAECQKAGLIVIYEVSGKRYLQINDFRQRLDRAKQKYPAPTENQTVNEIPEVVNEIPPEVEVEIEVEQEEKEKRRLLKNSAELGVVVYNAEESVLSNHVQFERICVSTGKSIQEAKDSLHKYHLYLEEKEQYPKGKKAVLAGFEKWLLNEKNFQKDGKGNTSQPYKTQMQI